MNRMKKFMALFLAVVLIAQTGFAASAQESASLAPSVQSETPTGTELQDETGMTEQQPEDSKDETTGETTETGQDGEDAAAGEVDGEQPGNPSEGTGTEEDGQAPPADQDQNQDQNQEQDQNQNQNQGQDQEQQQPSNAAGDGEGTEVGEPTEEEKVEADGTEALDASDALLEEELGTLNERAVDDTTYYVDAAYNGEEPSDGTEAAPYTTIQDAVDAIVECAETAESGTEYLISVAEGDYGRFLVPHKVSNITIQGQGDNTVISTLDGSSLEVDESEKHNSDGQGIIIWGANITLKDLKITSGTDTKDIWYASAVGSQDGMWGSSSETDTPIILDNVTFEGSGAGYAFMPQRSQFTVKNCRIDNYDQAIYFAGDTYVCQDCVIENNVISNCIYAIHGYFGGTDTELTKAMVIEGNHISGTEEKFAVIAVLDQANMGSLKLDIQNNTFSYTIVGAINQNKEGDVVQGSMEAVKDANTFENYSYVVDATNDGTNYSSRYYVPDYEDAQLLTWYADPYGEVGYEMYKAIWKYLDEHGDSLDTIIEFNPEDQVDFSMAKNAMIIDKTGNLEIGKKVTNNDLDTSVFTFEVQLYDKDDVNMENPLKLGLYKYINADGEETVVDLKETDGVITVEMKAGETVTIEKILPGTICKVTEVEKSGYEAENSELTAVIEENSTQTVTFTNKYIPDENPDTDPVEWETDKSKEATNLDENYRSDVTLSLPSAESVPCTDVVFVLDRSSSTTNARSEISTMLDNLLEITKTSDAEIKVSIVNFSYQVDEEDSQLELVPLSEETISDLRAKVAVGRESGTNLQAGIEKGTEILASDTSVSDENKYLILLTDGISHAWTNDSGDVMTIWGQGNADGITYQNGANSYLYFDDVKTKFAEIYNMELNDPKLNEDYDYPVYPNGAEEPFENIGENEAAAEELISNEKYIAFDEYDTHLSGVEKAVYLAAHAYADAASKYKCISLYWTSDYPVANEFMAWTATQGKAYDIGTDGSTSDFQNAFDEVEKEIVYLLDAGSRVIDEIGSTDDYDFMFVNDINRLKLTVGGQALDATRIDDVTYGFGKDESLSEGYKFILTYYENGLVYRGKNYGECFVWDINVPVEKAAPVQLTYTVELTNPKTTAGTYGEYDRYGENNKSGLYTNNSATLFPVDSKGNEGASEEFNKPTVSYTVVDHPATINITKKVQNSSGAATNVNATFYAAVFTDPQFTNRFGDVVELKLNGTSQVTVSVTVEAPADGSSRSYYVTETDKNGNVITGGKSFGYQIGIEGSMVTVSESAPTGSVTITNKQVASGNQGGGSNGGGSTGGGSSSGSGSSSSQTVTSAQTGDNTNLLLPIAVVVIAAAAMTVCLVVYRRKRS